MDVDNCVLGAVTVSSTLIEVTQHYFGRCNNYFAGVKMIFGGAKIILGGAKIILGGAKIAGS